MAQTQAQTQARELALLVRAAHRRIAEQRINGYLARMDWEAAYEPVRRGYWLALMEA